MSAEPVEEFLPADDAPLPPLPKLGADDLHFGADPDLLRFELEHLINRYLSETPRSRQLTIGPSEVGTPCARRLGYQLAGVAKVVERGPGWMPAVGTAVHAMLAEAVAEWNAAAGFSRYLIETRVEPGTIGGVPLRGHADLYDRVSGTVLDWKCVGVTTLRKVRKEGPSPLYRTQVQLYAHGFVARGLPVERVAIVYLPRSGELRDSVWHTEDYDPAVAEAALARADALATALQLAGPETVLPQLERADDCMYCPWHARSLTGDDPTPAASCPGVRPATPTSAEALIG